MGTPHWPGTGVGGSGGLVKLSATPPSKSLSVGGSCTKQAIVAPISLSHQAYISLRSIWNYVDADLSKILARTGIGGYPKPAGKKSLVNAGSSWPT